MSKNAVKFGYAGAKGGLFGHFLALSDKKIPGDTV